MSRAERTPPAQRKLAILAAAMLVAADCGHKYITRCRVADVAGVSSPLIAKYFRTMHALKLAVFKEAMRLEYMPVLQHCVSDIALDKFPEVKRLILDYIRSRM